MKLIRSIALASALLAGTAHAQQSQPFFTPNLLPVLCAPGDRLLELLDRENFEPIWMGQSEGGPTGIFVRDDMSWMLVASPVNSNGQICVIANGTNFRFGAQ